MGADRWGSRAPRATPPDDPEVRLRWLQGLYSVVCASYEWSAEHADRAHHLFIDLSNDKLYKAVMLRRVRDRELHRASIQGRALAWTHLRNACDKRLRDAIARLLPKVEATRRQLRQSVDLGIGEPCSAQEFTERLHQRLREIRGRKQSSRFQVAALTDEEGVVMRSAETVHAIARSYGVSQNRLSDSDDEAFAIWLTSLVPLVPTLTLPGGEAWTIRKALPVEVIRREARKQRKGKARALNPFIIEMLQCLPEGHPAELAYFELLLRCMEDGVYPAHFLQNIAVLIPKKTAGLLHMSLLRDIWLINHGAKLAERCLLHTALTAVGARVLPNHAGGCRGRGCTEQAFALHLCIDDALARRKPMYVLYVDLTKCFMSFSRTAADLAMRHAGIPEAALRALRGLVDNWKHGVAQGRYETAFGATDPFPILRGFLQGAQGSPEACKIMMDTIAQALELKVSGYSAFSPDGAGLEMGMLVFVDDAANATNEAFFLHRTTVFWSIWSRITDCQLNIKGKSKTVVQALEYKRGRDGTLLPKSTSEQFFIAGRRPGDPPRLIPNLLVNELYLYCGMATRMDGRHNDDGLATLKSKIASCGGQATAYSTSRRLALGCAGLGVYGNAFFYGTCFGGSFEDIENRLGPASRRAMQGAGIKGPRRSFSSPRVQLHAKPGGITAGANDDLAQHIVDIAGPAAFVSGYGNAHVWPAMMAAGLMTLVNALASPLHTPAADRAHHAVARVLWTLGLRRLNYGPRGIWLGPVSEHLRTSNIVERPLWLLCQIGAGYLPLVDCHFDEWSPLRPERWPGYPSDWVSLWHGGLYDQLRSKGVTFCPILAAGGIAELANLCDELHGDFLSEDEILEAHPRAIELGASEARRELRGLLGAISACHIAPVPGRPGWAMADAAEGVIPSYAPAAEYGLFRQVSLAHLSARKRSGDGGARLATLLDVNTDLSALRAAIHLLPDEVATSFTDVFSGVPYNSIASRSRLKHFLLQFPELIPVIAAVTSTSEYVADVSGFWSIFYHARFIAARILSGTTEQASEQTLQRAHQVLACAKAQGVDWLMWLSARPENDREPLPDPESPNGEATESASPTRPSDGSRSAILQERREQLLGDVEALQRVEVSLQEYQDQNTHIEEARQFREWLREGGATHLPPSSDEDERDEMPGGATRGGGGMHHASISPKVTTPTPVVPCWMSEPLLLCDFALSYLTPAMKQREAMRPPLDTDEACRVIRSTDRFGTLLISLHPQAPPTDSAVHRAFVEAKERILGAQSRSEGGISARHPRWQVARCRIDAAWLHLRDRDNRMHAWSAWLGQRRGPVTNTIKCVLHGTALHSLLASPVAGGPGRALGATVGSEITELLAASEPHPTNPHLRTLDISYRHSERGARLVAAGFVRFSREYGVGADPFKCSRACRDAAMGEVSHDLDDAVSFPTAQQALFPSALLDRGTVIRMDQSAILIAHPKEVRLAVGRHFLREDLLGSDEIYNRAKVLLSAVENGASCEVWIRRQPPGDVRSSSVCDDLQISAALVFNLATFAREQEARARWLAASRPDLVRYLTTINTSMEEGDRDSDLTAKSYILQDYEGASRRAKLEWAHEAQAQVINLQHDGVRMRIPFHCTIEAVVQQISDACSVALGYRQTVVVKSSPSGSMLLDRVRPSILPPRIPQNPPTPFTPIPSILDSARHHDLKDAFAALLGDASPPPAGAPCAAGVPQLALDGAARRAIYFYESNAKADVRLWHQRVQGGYHRRWEGRGAAWLNRVRQAYIFDDLGRLKGNPFHSDCPLAARFWWECQAVCERANKPVKAEECRFVFDKLLTIESEYPVTHFVATDGSKKIDADSGEKHVGRACVTVSAGVMGSLVLGGQLDVFADNFERHSYEAELAAFHDHLAATADTVSVIVTDCLSGMQAGHAFPGRTVSSQAARYRDKELGNLAELEQRHRAVLYVHIHSHTGITPNEAADAVAMSMLHAPLLPLDLQPSAHAKCRVFGVKRGVGRAAFDFCAAVMVAKLAGASSFTLLENEDTWPLLCRHPVRAKLLTEATHASIMDARADRCGLLADRLGDGLRERVLPGVAQIDRAREYGAQKGGWEWWCQVHAPCPCQGCFMARDITVAGLWRPPPARAPQTRWHAITTCAVGESVILRSRAEGWLSQRLSDFGTAQARYALAALSGQAHSLGPREKHAALRFMLGLPDTPRSQRVLESKETARSLALGYGRGFLKWISAILREGRQAAHVAKHGSAIKVNAVRTTVVSYRGRDVIVQRPAPRSVWTASRGLRETWDGACLVRRAFRALRLWTIMAGPEVLDRPPRVRGVPVIEPDRQGGRDAGCRAYDQWADYIVLVTTLAGKLYDLKDKLLAIAGSHRRKLVWLRHAGFDPTIERRKRARVEAVRQAALQARQRKQEAQAGRAAAHAQRREKARVARKAADDLAEAARLASAAVTRPMRSSVEATIAAMDVDRRCNQSRPLEPSTPAAPVPADQAPPPFVCTRGHFLVPAPVRGGPQSFQVRCNGPCGRSIGKGVLRWMCEGHGCDIDICLGCVVHDDQEGALRGRIRCPRGHSMLFLVVVPPSHLQLKCDGGCRRTLREGTWIYRCATCQLDLCAACSPEGVLPVAAPPPPRVKAKRNRGQRASAPDRPAKRRAGPACRGKRDPRAPTLFDSDSDEEPADSGGDAPGAARGHQPGADREGEAPVRELSRGQGPAFARPGGAPSQPHGEGPGRKRSGIPSIRSRGQGS
jgi:ribonuclease HI